MMQLTWDVLVGKVVKSVDTKFGDNVVKITISDPGGENVEDVVIDTDAVGFGLYCPILFSVYDYMERT